ncbi:MAG: hypothetical protein WCH75_12650 [Candidatus Binatia bacterium]
MTHLTGLAASWCSFATWASKQAGQTIRQEDLIRAFEERFYLSAEISAALDAIADKLKTLSARLQARHPREAILRALNPAAALARAGDAVARGNKKVFEEIGREFARFLETFHDDSNFDIEKTERFCAGLRPGEPPDGQRFLGEAFRTYCEARFCSDRKAKAELMLLANLCAGYHEQIRLQPEILEALNAALENTLELKRNLGAILLPGFWLRARSRVLGQRGPLDALFDRLIQAVNRLIRQVITDHLMTLHLPGPEVLRLGMDLRGTFAQTLEEIQNSRLKEMLSRTDVTPNSLRESGAQDWSDFTDRMHFITDFFRTYQERQSLLDPPFTSEQVALLKSGIEPRRSL